MDIVLLILRLLLAAVFAVAGIAKLLDLPGSVSAVEGFGVSWRFSRLVGYALPFLEIAIAIGLLPVSTAPLAAAAGTALMALFVVAMAVNLAQGKKPECHCFGKLHSTPIGWQTLARNGAIGAGAVIVAVAGPGASLVSSVRGTDVSSQPLLVLLLVALVVIGWQWMGMARLLRTATAMGDRISLIEGLVNGDSPSDVPGPEVGAAAPGFLLHSIGKGMVSLDSLKAVGKPIFVVFAEPTCSVCNMMIPKLARWANDLSDVLTVAVITTGDEAANRRKVDRYGLSWVLMQEGREVTMSYRVPGTPSAVLLDRNGIVADPLVYGPDPIIAMLEGIANVTINAPEPPTEERSKRALMMPLQPAAGAD